MAQTRPKKARKEYGIKSKKSKTAKKTGNTTRPQVDVPLMPVGHRNGHGPVEDRNGTDRDIVASKKRSSLNWVLALLLVLSWLAAMVMGVFVIIGCMYSTAGLDKLYLVELRTNQTYDASLRVGYYGGCMSVANTTTVAGTTNASSASYETYCVDTMRTKVADDLSEAFLENLNLTLDAQASVKATLNSTIPYAKHFQADVFYWEPPVLHFVVFALSSLVLFGLMAGSSPQRVYKAIVMIALLLGAFALGLALVTTISSLQALNAILDGGRSKEEQLLDNDIYISRGHRLEYLQAALAVIAALFYLIVGILFVRRRPQGNMIQAILPGSLVFMRGRGQQQLAQV